MMYEAMARKHWTKYLPGLTKELKAKGIFEQEIKKAADQAREEYASQVSQGTNPIGAKEFVMNEYILLPAEEDVPEDDEADPE